MRSYSLAEEKPSTAFILSLIAGILIVVGGVVGSVFMGMMGSWYGGWSGMMGPGMMEFPWWGFGMAFGITGLVIGIIVILSAIMLDSRPKEHKTWGIIILVFSILSIIGGMGGFGIGLILGIIGGALAISWQPSPPIPPTAPHVTGRFCPQCGKAVSGDAKFCPHCGKEIPT